MTGEIGNLAETFDSITHEKCAKSLQSLDICFVCYMILNKCTLVERGKREHGCFSPDKCSWAYK